ncbi:MAG: CPBP family intramembrane metalloprotease [Deferribacteraceae bacterium]|jgi:membrane protease YdiL (CAAX protease family)|nr:CPBP family intramembrane metalloprotease [Deferribacteraceae bacterium]
MIRSTLLAIALAVPVIIWKISAGIEGVEPSIRNLLVLLAVAPISEEIIFRGFIQEFLIAKMGKLLSVLVVSILFTAAHLLIGTLQGEAYLYNALVFFPSIAISWHYARFRSLPAAIAIHALYNVTAFVI